MGTRGQFHQHSTSSFYARRSQKRNKDSQVKQLFVLLESSCIKDARRMLMKLNPVLNCDKLLFYELSTKKNVFEANHFLQLFSSFDCSSGKIAIVMEKRPPDKND